MRPVDAPFHGLEAMKLTLQDVLAATPESVWNAVRTQLCSSRKQTAEGGLSSRGETNDVRPFRGSFQAPEIKVAAVR